MRSAFALALLLGTAASAWDGGTALWAERRAAALLGGIDGVTLASVDIEGGRAILRGLHVGRGGWTASIGRLSLPGPAAGEAGLVAPAHAQAATLLMDDVRIAGGHNVYRIPHLEVRGTALGAAELAALVDPAKPGTLAERVARISAASIVAPTVVIEIGEAGGKALPGRATLRDVSLTDVVAGRVGTAEAQGVDLVDAGAAEGAAPSATAGRARAVALDLPLAIAMATTTRRDAAEIPAPVLASASIEALDLLRGRGGKLKVGAVRAGALRGRPLLHALAGTLALGQKSRADSTLDERTRLADGIVDALGSASIDHIEVDALAISGKPGDGIAFSLDRAEVDGLAGLKLSALSLDGLDMATPQADVSFSHLALVGVDQSGLTEGLRRALATGELGGFGEDLAPARVSLALVGLKASTPTDGTPGNSPDGSRHLWEVPNLAISADPLAGRDGLRTSSEARLIFPMPPGRSDSSFGPLDAMHLAALDIRTGYGLTLDRTAQRLTVDRVGIDVEKVGRVSFGAVLGHVGPELTGMGGGTGRRDEAIERVTLESLRMSVVDAGLARPLFDYLAEDAGVSVPSLKADLKGQIRQNVGQMLGGTPASARLQAALSAFVDDPRNLDVAITIPEGVTFGALKPSDEPKSLPADTRVEATVDR